MPADYYKTLGVDKKATEEEIKKAYKKLALKHHPDRNQGSEASSKKFKEVSEAFEVLTDGNKRAVYDQFGEEGLKGGGMPSGGGAGGNPFAGFSSSGGFPGAGGMPGMNFGGSGGRRGFEASNPEDIFSSIFGNMAGGGSGFSFSSGGMPGMSSMGGGMDMDDDGFGSSFPGGFPSSGGGRPKARARAHSSDAEQEATKVNKPLACSLEELYTGCTKKLKINRTLQNGGTEPKIIEVSVKPGWKAGTKVTYRGAGNEEINAAGRVQSQDIVFVVEEKPHDRFTRDGDDLIYNLKVPLADALCGPSSDPASAKKSIQTLDKRLLSVAIPFPKAGAGGQTLKQGQEIRVANEGFPKKGGSKGALKVKIDLVVPNSLTAAQSKGIRELMG